MEKSSSNISGSSSNKSSHWCRDPRSRVAEIPLKCWCRANIVEKISCTDDNPYRRYYRCGFAYTNRPKNDPHVFKWVDEAYKEDIQQLEHQVGQLEKEIAMIKSGGDQNMVTLLNDFETKVFEHVEDMLASSRNSMKRIVALVFGVFMLVDVIVVVVKK